jgi:hypothetical protein
VHVNIQVHVDDGHNMAIDMDMDMNVEK